MAHLAQVKAILLIIGEEVLMLPAVRVVATDAGMGSCPVSNGPVCLLSGG